MRPFLIAFFIFIVIKLNAQYEFDQGTFRFYVSAGLNTSQMGNDSLGGFNKWGPTVGIGGYFMISDHFSTNLEINYTMRGARGYVFDEFNRSRLYHRYIGLDYIEAPIFLSLHDRNRASIGAGVVLASLIQSSQALNWKNIDEITPLKYKPIDIGFLLNANLYFKEQFAFNLRFTHSLVPANESHPDYANHYHSVLSVRGIMMF